VNDIKKMQFWKKFCGRFKVVESAVPLFELDSDGNVAQKVIGKKTVRSVLKRSNECDDLILKATSLLHQDWHSGAKQYDGMVYMMGRKQPDWFEPLYIGKTESAGRIEGKFSENLIGLEKNRAFFARWGDGYAYHIGNLSAWVLPGHADKHRKENYGGWAKCLFNETTATLRHPIHFWAMPWDSSEVGIWEDFGPTSLAFLENLLIGVAADISPDLLNKQGLSR
jgi:hypothetical protein